MSLHQAYKTRIFKQRLLAVAVLVIAFIFFWLSLVSGYHGINIDDSIKFFGDDEQFLNIVESIRLPRALAAFLVGMLLGLSGVVMQGVLRNPLASPFTLGISQAAAFGASFAIIFFQNDTAGFEFLSFWVVPFFAFIASMVCSFLIILLGRKMQMSPTILILAGVGLGSLFHSGTMFLQFFTTEINAAATLFWTFGDLSKASYEIILVLFVVFVVSFFVIWSSHWKFDALGFGDESAYNKGVNVGSFRIVMLLFGAFCTAVAVSFFGIIGFIGLVAPHIVRLVIGSSHAALIPLSALSGGALLLGADFFARMMLYPSILPVGIISSFIGAPMLLYLLLNNKGSR
jgi:iron complex transport system permease protein